MSTLFYLNALLAVFAMGLAMTISHAIHALLCMIFSLLCLAICMYLLAAPLAASLQVIVYAGAIMVLFVFAVMFLQVPTVAIKQAWVFRKRQILFAITAFAIFWVEVFLVIDVTFSTPANNQLSIKDIAVSLFTEHGFLLEVASFILLAGLIAAIFVGRSFLAHQHLVKE